MKFIRDIIADKQEQVHPVDLQAPTETTETDVMAAIMDQAPTQSDALQLGGEYMVPGAAPEENIFTAEPEVPAYESEAPATHDILSDWDTGQTDNTEPEADVFEDSAVSQAVASFFEETHEDEASETAYAEPEEEEIVPEVDLGQFSEPAPAAQEAPAERPYELFRRSQKQAELAASQEPEEPSAPLSNLRPAPAPRPAPQPQQAAPVSPQTQATVAPARTERRPEPDMPSPAAQTSAPIDVPPPAMGRGSSRAGRVKTRLLGFNPGQATGSDPFARNTETTASEYTQFPVGWLAVVKGPGRGATFTLYSGVTNIGRGEDQTLRLDFGDNSISRSNHAAIAFDAEQNNFFIGHGGKANLVRLNNRPVLSTEELGSGDLIRIGETTLRFVPLCGGDFGWNEAEQNGTGHVS